LFLHSILFMPTHLQVAKWGNSLAMRLPAELVRRFGLREGDHVEAQITADGALTLRPAGWSRRAFAAEVRAAREAMSMGRSVIEELRGTARY
jgi:antitoxin MazE